MKLLKYSQIQKRISEIFLPLQKELKDLLPHARVEHIGASSIPGSVSKGDLDIFVGVPKDQFNSSLKKVTSIGFHEKKETLRTDTLCMLITDRYNYDVAIQLVANGAEQEDFIKFRDILRNSPQLLDEYNQIKIAAKDLPDHLYRDKKAAFIKKTLLIEKNMQDEIR